MIKDMRERGILTNEMMTRMLGGAEPVLPSSWNDGSHTK